MALLVLPVAAKPKATRIESPIEARMAREAPVVLNDDDPGWPITKDLLLGLLPGASILVRRRLRRNANGLVLLRQLFMSFCLSLVLYGVVLAALWPSASKEARSPGLAVGLVLMGVLTSVAGRVVEKPLDCADDKTLAESYRTRFFLQIAFPESAALFGFVGYFIAAEWWVYPAGAAIALVGFARAAPTRRNLQRDQDRLDERGCRRLLVRVLTASPPPRGES